MANESNLVPFTGLWVNESSSGKKYFSGSAGGVRVLIFKNDKKDNPKAPDYQMYFTANKRKENDDTGPDALGPPPKEVDNSDDLPF